MQPRRLDLGPRFATDGIVDQQPAGMGPPFVTRVPLPDSEGHDRGGIRLPLVAAPLGTHTGWNLRRPEIGAADKLARWSGSFIPFARTEDERRASGDPRPSIEVRYASRSDYVAKVRAAAQDLVEDRFVLPSDVAEIVVEAEAFYDRVQQRDPTDLSCAYTVD